MTTLDAIIEKIHERPLPLGWRQAQLSEIAEINPRRPKDFRRNSAAPTTFVPMPAVDGLSGTIAQPETRRYEEVATGYTFFCEGDVLFAKITPCMQNGKHAVARGLIDGIGFASTEFHIIRPGHDLLADWVFLFVRQPSVLHEATSYFTGAVGQQRVPDSFLKCLTIPLPPLPEQQRITATLREQMAAVEKARSAVQQRLMGAKALADAFLRRYLEEGEARQWPSVVLGDVCEIEANQVDPKLPEYRDLPHVNGENIESGTGRLYGIRTAAEDRMTSGKYLFEPGVVLYSKLRPYLRKAVVADFRGLCSADMYPLAFHSTRVDRRFALWVLLAKPFTDYAVGESQRARMPKLNRGQLFAWHCPLPSMNEQRRVADELDRRINGAQRLIDSVLDEQKTIDHLSTAILRGAFTDGI
jgi:type I restriction enzyme, S subunit